MHEAIKITLVVWVFVGVVGVPLLLMIMNEARRHHQ